MRRWAMVAAGLLLAASAHAQTGPGSAAGDARAADTRAGAAPAVDETLPSSRPAMSVPSRPSRPLGASTPGSVAAPDAASAAPGLRDPSATSAYTTGGSGSAGLAAMGGGLESAGAYGTNQMGAGSLMPDCPTGLVRSLGTCVTITKAREAQRPKQPASAPRR